MIGNFGGKISWQVIFFKKIQNKSWLPKIKKESFLTP